MDLVKELHKYFTFTDNLFMNINAETIPHCSVIVSHFVNIIIIVKDKIS